MTYVRIRLGVRRRCARDGPRRLLVARRVHEQKAGARRQPRELPPPEPRTDGAIYQAGQEMVLFADLKARRVGDVLTIVLNEATAASKNAVTKTTKNSSVTDTGPSIFGKSITTKGVPILDTTLSGAHRSTARARLAGNSFVGSLTVTVTECRATAIWWSRATRA